MAAVRRARRRRGERGAELVEFAIVLPLLLLVLLGILDFGLLFQRYQVVTNAAREGARVAVLDGYDAAAVEARVRAYLTASGLNEEPTVEDPVVASSVVAGQCISIMTLTVSYPYSYLFVGGIAGYFGAGGFGATSLTATTAMRWESAAAACS